MGIGPGAAKKALLTQPGTDPQRRSVGASAVTNVRFLHSGNTQTGLRSPAKWQPFLTLSQSFKGRDEAFLLWRE